MRPNRWLLPVLMACLAPAWGACAWGTALDVKADRAKTFYVDQRAGANQVSIFSESTIEDFTSVVNKVGGEFQLNPKQLESLTGRFWVRVADIRTGIDLRDQHLQSADWLDAARHPLITIEIASAEDVQKKSANTAGVVLVGKCSLHGVTRDVRIPATLVYLDESPTTMRRAPGDLISLRANLEVKLSDFKVTGPQGEQQIGLKVGDVQAIRVSIFATSEKPPVPLGEPPAGPPAAPSTGPATRPSGGVPVLPPPQRPAPR